MDLIHVLQQFAGLEFPDAQTAANLCVQGKKILITVAENSEGAELVSKIAACNVNAVLDRD
jgi:hypothetical protein